MKPMKRCVHDLLEAGGFAPEWYGDWDLEKAPKHFTEYHVSESQDIPNDVLLSYDLSVFAVSRRGDRNREAHDAHVEAVRAWMVGCHEDPVRVAAAGRTIVIKGSDSVAPPETSQDGFYATLLRWTVLDVGR